MKEGTTEFSDETAGLSDSVTEEIQDTIEDMLGTNEEVTSFISEKNTNVESVQFVIKTSAIEKTEETNTTETTQTTTSFIDKLLTLFGIK